MDTSQWIGFYFPILVMIAIRFQNKRVLFYLKKRKKRSEVKMSNDMLLYCVNKECNISTGSLGKSFSRVTVLEVIDNWVKVEKKNKIDLINCDYIQSIKIL